MCLTEACSRVGRMVALLLPLAGLAPRIAAAAPAAASCTAVEHRQLDFWVGDWDAYDVGDEAKPAARVQVDVILDGCALHEVYAGTNGLHGESFSLFDASRQLWHQSWVTNRGQLLVIEGRLQDDAVRLQGQTLGPGGKPLSIRALWRRQGAAVRETAETSSDGGLTWTGLFDMVFRAHKP
jgi:hypothetical protein